MAKQILSCTVNDEAVEVLVPPYETLLDVLREELGLTGPKEGCGTGDCGACSVHVDGKLVGGCDIVTSLSESGELQTLLAGGAASNG